jgi:hypothetical protein
MAIATAGAPVLPNAFRHGLRRVDRRIRRVALTRGAGALLLVLAAGLALGMTADVAIVLPRPVRWALWTAWIIGSVATAVVMLVRPQARRVGWTDLAAVAEVGHPKLAERLTSSVALLAARERAHGSHMLIEALTDDAARQADGLDLARAIDGRAAARWLAAGTAMTLLVVTPIVIWPDPMAAIARRFLAPWAGIERVGRFVIAVRPGDIVVARGDDVAIAADVRPRFGPASTDSAWLEWTNEAGATQGAAMIGDAATRNGVRTWRLTLPQVGDSVRYRVTAGPSQSRRHAITAVDPPAIAGLNVSVDPPGYTREPRFVARDPARVEAREGSLVTLSVTTRQPIRRAELDWPKEDARHVDASSSPSYRPGEGQATSWTFVATAVASGPFGFRLTDQYSLNNRPEPPRRLMVRPDAPPTVALGGSDEPVEASADDTVSVDMVARDDIAVAEAEVHYAVARAGSPAPPETGVLKLDLPGLGTRLARGEARLPLKPLKLRAGDGVSYRIKVADNRPAPRGPNVAWTSIRGVKVVEKAEPLLARRAAAERAKLQEMLNALKKSAAENRQGAEQLRYAADAAQRGNGRWDVERQQTLARRESAARDVVEGLREFARELDDHPLFGPMARPAHQAADVEAETGRQQLEQARRAADAAHRLEDLKRADASLASTQVRLDELQRRFDALARLEDDRRRLRELAERQEELAAYGAELGGRPEDRARLDQAQAEQARLRRELDELVGRSPELKADVLAVQAQAAAELAERARALARRQREEARQSGDMAPHERTLRALAEAQRALEEDARRLALRVDAPLAENGRARLNVDALAQPVEPIQRGLLEQGAQRLEGAEAELRRLARDLDDVRADPKALARRLAQRQENVRVQAAEALRDTVQDRNQPTSEERAALGERLKPLADREAAIVRLAAAIPSPKDQPDAARNALNKTTRALDELRDPKPNELENRQTEARDALNHLANVLPDLNQQREPARPHIADARARTQQIAGEVERHMRETGPQPGRPFDPQRADAELTQRLAPLAQQAKQVATDLDALAVENRVEPQRTRAARRASLLADALAHPNRDALPARVTDARAAAERLEQKFNGQVPADDRAVELAAEINGLAQAEPGARGEEARRIASALRNLNAPDAPLAQAEAARAAAEAAGDPAALPRAVEAADAFARRLADAVAPAEQAAALARAERGLEGADAPRDPVARARTQRAIAEDLARVPAPAAETRAAAEAVGRALELAERVAEPQRNDGQPPPTAEATAAARTRAAESLDALARSWNARRAVPARPDAAAPARPLRFDDPALDLPAARADEARTLAQRERQLRERLQAILGERVEPQRQLRDESVSLGRELADLRDEARDVSPRSHGPAHAAADLLQNHAPREMDQGVEHLSQGRAEPARDAQRRAAEAVERAAQQAEDLAAALRADRPLEANEAPAHAGELAAARAAQAHAGQELAQARDPSVAPQASRAASAAMRQAAQGLRAAAQAQSSSLARNGHPHLPSGTPRSAPRDPKSAPAGTAEPELAEIQALVRSQTGRAWGELPGHLRTEILQMSQGRYREEYSRLIRLYFQEIAAEGSATRNP